MGDAICTIAEPTQSVGTQSYFKIRKDRSLAVRWSFTMEWIAHCVGSVSQDVPVILTFRTGTGTVCGTTVDVPITDATAPSGEFQMACAPFDTKATFDLRR
jgi:hypothetical protein